MARPVVHGLSSRPCPNLFCTELVIHRCLLVALLVTVCACVCVCHRVDSLASAVFLSLLHVLFAWPRHVASPLPAPVLQGQETDRVVYSCLLPLLDWATSSFVCQQQFWVHVLLTCCWVFWCSWSTGNVQKQKIAPPGTMYKIEMKSVMLNEDKPLRPRTIFQVYRFNSTQSTFITVTDALHSFSRGQSNNSLRTCQGQMLEVVANSSRPKLRTKFWPRGQLVLKDLTSLDKIKWFSSEVVMFWGRVSPLMPTVAIWIKL